MRRQSICVIIKESSVYRCPREEDRYGPVPVRGAVSYSRRHADDRSPQIRRRKRAPAGAPNDTVHFNPPRGVTSADLGTNKSNFMNIHSGKARQAASTTSPNDQSAPEMQQAGDRANLRSAKGRRRLKPAKAPPDRAQPKTH
jgi:hypothetical protein